MRALIIAAGLLATSAAVATTYRPTTGVYQLIPDARRCPSPLCGGYWIRAVNHSKTTCHDGNVQSWCYISEVDYDAAGWTQDEAIRFQQSVGTSRVLMYGTQHSVFHPVINQSLAVLEPIIVLKEYEVP